jgi:uncharacterized membrane protein
MRSLGENQFHLLMGVLVIGSLFLDRLMAKVVTTWTSPQVGLITFALGLVWVGLFAAHRAAKSSERIAIAEDKVDRLAQLVRALEDLERERRRLP